jgi:microcystin degradation protein MlrC
MMRIAVGSIMQETNTFSPAKTGLEAFENGYLWRGAEMLDRYAAMRVEVSGFLATLRAAEATPVPLLAAHAFSGGPVTRAAFDALVGELADRLRAALPLDGVLLALHGAMVVEDDPDAEGALLAAARAVVGEGVPIAASLDLHGHITPSMLAGATILVGYEEYPHIDMYETGERTARLLLDTLRGEIRPALALAKRPMIVSPVNARTTDGPLRMIVGVAREMERSGRVLAASLFPVQPWIDVPELGFAALVVADDDQRAAQEAAEELAGMAWDARAAFEPELVTLADAVRIGLAAPEGMLAVGDAGDAPSSGAAADHAAVLRELLAQGADRADRPTYLTLRDAEAAGEAARAGIGAEITLAVGHKLSRADGSPFTVTGRVCTLTNGQYRMKGPGGTGTLMNMGLTAVLAIGMIRLVLKSLPSLEWDPALFYSVGLDPADAAIVFVKSPSHFRVAFGPLAREVLAADTPGAARVNMRALSFQHVTRPLYPLDEL